MLLATVISLNLIKGDWWALAEVYALLNETIKCFYIKNDY